MYVNSYLKTLVIFFYYNNNSYLIWSYQRPYIQQVRKRQ